MGRFREWLRNPETIGAPDCPIIRRWTIIDEKSEATASHDQKPTTLIPLPKWLTGDRKLMIHFFPPNVEDRDPHDHPRGFWTFVLRGLYYDLVPCPNCGGSEEVPGNFGDPTSGGLTTCPVCRDGLVVGDTMIPGTLRYRKPEHTHITQTGPQGAWTIVVMGPQARAWGFWRAGEWWAWRKYEERFGFAMRCPSDEELEGAMLKYGDSMVDAKPTGAIYKHAPVGVASVLGQPLCDRCSRRNYMGQPLLVMGAHQKVCIDCFSYLTGIDGRDPLLDPTARSGGPEYIARSDLPANR